jgi:hypothetical protein
VAKTKSKLKKAPGGLERRVPEPVAGDGLEIAVFSLYVKMTPEKARELVESLTPALEEDDVSEEAGVFVSIDVPVSIGMTLEEAHRVLSWAKKRAKARQ